MTNEVLGDLTTGSSGGHTDLAPPDYTGATGSPIAAYYNGTHVMFRVRLGGASTASKGYSVLIDTNNDFYDPSRGQTPSSTKNPGFEFEVVFASNFDVSIYDHRTVVNGGPKIWSGSVNQFSQRAVAASTASNNPDYFYDFYVPLSAFPGITADTPLRMSGITITSAQSGLTGTVSDVGGVNFLAYGQDPYKAWIDVINSFPATTLNQLQSGEFRKIIARAPTVTGPVTTGSTTITGTSVEAAGSTITVLRNGSSIGTTTVSATGSWSLTIAGNLLATGEQITATVTPTNKIISTASSAVTVTAPAVCISTSSPTITGRSTGNPRYLTGSTPYIGRQRITIYNVTVEASGIYTYVQSGSYVFTTTTANTALPTSLCAAGTTTSSTCMTSTTGTVDITRSGTYVITTTPVNTSDVAIGCESLRSNQLCYNANGNSAVTNSNTVTVTNAIGSTGITYQTLSELPAGLTSISGILSSYTAGMSVILFRNGTQTTYRVSPTSTNWTINTTGLSLAVGDILNFRVEETLSCGASLSALSNLATIRATTPAPVINAIAQCGFVKTITGTSPEPGSVITIFTNGTSTGLTGIVASTGVWSVDVSTLNNGNGIAAGVPITARAKTAGKATSVFSNFVSSSAATAIPSGSTFTINPIQEPLAEEQLFTIRGTGPASTSTTTYQVNVTIAGTPFPPVTTTSTGTWELSGIAASEVYTGATISATFSSNTSSCPSAPITTIVQCRPPSSNFTTSINGSNSICYNNTVSVILSGSEKGVAYRLINNGTPTGASVLGTGGPITLASGVLSTSTSTLSVRAVDVGSECSTTGIGGNLSVTVAPAPTQPTALVASTPSGCSQVITNITLEGPTAGYTYQLINFDTKAAIGSPVTAATSTAPASITLGTSIPLYSTTTLGVRITPSGGCTSESNRTVTITVAEGPSLRQAVTIDKPTPCTGDQVTIRVATEYNNGYTYTIRDNNGTAVGTSFTGTGTVVSRTTTYTGGITSARSFYVEVTGGCATNARLNTTVSATLSSTPVQANAGTAREVCGTVTLDANAPSPGSGYWTKTDGPAGGTITDPTNPRSTVTGLPSGEHTFTWTITTECGQSTPVTSSSTVKITVNCAAEYIVNPPKYASEYRDGDRLATATDSDGGITNAVIFSGTLPSWAQLQPNGNITVRTGGKPVAGTYTFTVRTTDAQNRTTGSPVTLVIYGDAPTVQPLPVELVYFTATVNKGVVKLQWLTASEENNDRFEVERSTDGKIFESIGTVKGAGNSNREMKYVFTDSQPLASTAYYRLKQVDSDDKYEYSKVISVNGRGDALQDQLQVYPNPFQGELNVAMTTAETSDAVVQIIDLQGRVVLQEPVQLQSGLNEFSLKLASIRAGVYVLKITGGNTNATVKVVRTQ
ncbi:T9SS type A sorting domain-containing protein [Pontibacter harenae]|uniref:T9SS type A sorting domain-containing protein n=1 Tax=Pontibacter harenae TaxID=2894083 RepID=UPI001E3B0E8A|nr:T9SS type A sorting domain-containing protein [Pontibacter harenae]MCC9166324.1 T9SS type A sorting domain-containing protein [Pontibacter harenae]